jgi:hypothetical protein
VLLPENETPPYDRSDPRQAAQADRRWAKMTAAGTSVAMLGFFSLVVQIFKPSSKPMVWEQQSLRSGDPLGLEPDHTSTAPYAGRVTLPKA